MKNKDIIKSIGISLLLFLVIQITAFFSYSVIQDGWILVSSAIWMIITIPAFYIIKSNKATVIYFLFNALMAGITISGYYRYEGLEVYNILIVSLCYLVILAVNYMFMYFLQFNRKANVIFAGMIGIGIAIGVIKWINGSLLIGSSIVFTLITILCMNISFMYFLNNKREYNFWKIIKLSSMLVFGGIFFTVIIAISEGDAMEFFGYFWDDKKKKRNV